MTSIEPASLNVSASDSRLSILIVRPDRLGDVIVSTPVFEVIKRHYPRSRLMVMVREAVAPVIRGIPFIDDVLIYDLEGKEARHSGLKGFFRLVSDIRRGGFRIAVTLQSERRIALALYLARIRYRIGPFSKIHSFIFYNRGVRQHRSLVEMHEADYNLQLLRRIGIRVGARNIQTRVHIPSQVREDARVWLQQQGWNGGPIIVVHPGMGGSALNWPETHYIELIRAVLKEGTTVLITGGLAEAGLLERIRDALGTLNEKAIFYRGARPIDFLGGLFSWCSLVVAPSTGPLHLAVALGKRVVTFFPPIRVQSAIRWGPYLSDESRATIFVPEAYCGEDFECRKQLCNYFPCMKSLTVPQALEQVRRQLQAATNEETNSTIHASSAVPASLSRISSPEKQPFEKQESKPELN
ncbi:MAG TPA: glycosyltransferase family 9 protein [Bdellovibrionota bacterium]|nr:glycosyltransferase family 9 protein [Bdellovibrionota bacterium]